ncbi:MAG TPA: nucleoside deaminase [Actinobacteria bacterium]|nr:nucleoside deaminase [Actinomycetota bacterium]
MRLPEYHLTLPAWMADVAADEVVIPDVVERMRFVVGLAARNVAEGTGGPFGAAVFVRDTGRLVAPGVNRVVSTRCSIAHAEIVAIAMAGQVLGSFDLGAGGEMELVSSVEPCAMCLGAIPWSGVASLVCGARDEDARAVGFDEGDKPRDWIADLVDRDIEVHLDVLREEAARVLYDYALAGGIIYNGRVHHRHA